MVICLGFGSEKTKPISSKNTEYGRQKTTADSVERIADGKRHNKA